ncbi:MAG: TrkH family potassium uptake protein [Cytophagaceae bacterium]
MSINSRLIKLRNLIEDTRDVLVKALNRAIIYIGISNILLIIYKFGFEKAESHNQKLLLLIDISLVILFLCLFVRSILEIFQTISKRKIFSEYLLLLFILIVIVIRHFPVWAVPFIPWGGYLGSNIIVYITIALIFIIEISRKSLNVYALNLNPARLFIYSFGLIILLGAGLLMLPNATTNGISLIDALFTSTSAVCVTGLVVLNTANDFTFLGQVIILFLFQLGGLGIMTFTSFFGFLFHGGFSFQNELFLQNFMNEDKMGHVFKSILKVITITLGIEAIAATFIYLSTDVASFQNHGDHVFFSIFHAVAGFCNSGFSTLPDGLYEAGLRFNYTLHLIVAFTIIFGGLGFPIVFNFYKYSKHYLKNKWRQVIYNETYKHSPRIININTKLAIMMTAILLVAGTFLFFLAEYNNSLLEHSWYGKIVTSFFGSVTPRSGGYNTVNMGTLMPATVLIYLFLMWVGASPGSTGGGIKTTSFAVAILTTIGIAKGRDRLEIYKREISEESVKRALAVIILSFLVIGSAILLVTIFDKEKSLITVTFECFSAYTTTGLSLGITPDLSSYSKLIITATMFLGRIGMLTVIIGFVTKVQSLRYKYPKESIFIN